MPPDIATPGLGDGQPGGAQRDGRNIRLLLDTGLAAPVSRANVGALKAAAWF